MEHSVSQATPKPNVIERIREDTNRLWRMVEMLERMTAKLDEQPAIDPAEAVAEAESILA